MPTPIVPADKRKPLGRPPVYDSARHPILVQALARMGYTLTEISKALSVSPRTVSRWATDYPDFANALKGSKIEADSMVESSLYKRAIGYEYEESTASASKDGKPARVQKTKKHMPSDVTACIFWLKNRRPDKWRTNPEVEGSNVVGQAAYLILLEEWRKTHNATGQPNPEANSQHNGVDETP